MDAPTRIDDNSNGAAEPDWTALDIELEQLYREWKAERAAPRAVETEVAQLRNERTPHLAVRDLSFN